MAVQLQPEQTQTSSNHQVYGRIARNTLIYLSAQLASWVISFLSISIIPRTLGETSCGELAVIGCAFGPVAAAFGFGLEQHLMQAIGWDPSQTERLLGGCIGLRLVLQIPAMLCCLVALHLLHPSATLWYLGCWAVVFSIPGAYTELLRAVLAGTEQAKRVSILDMISGFTPLLALPFLRYGPMALMVPGAIMAVLILLARLYWVRETVRIRPIFNFALWRQIIRGGIPFVIMGFVGILHGTTSTFVLRYFSGDAAVGELAQAGRLFGTFLFVPTALGYALLPPMARIANSDPHFFQRTQKHVLSLLIIIGLPIMMLMLFLAHPLCLLLYGPHKFVHLPLAIQVYSLALIPIFIVSVMYQFLVAQNRAALWNLFYSGTVGLYVVAGALFIPLAIHRLHNGVVGAVAATAFSEGCTAVVALVLLKTNPFSSEFFSRVGKALVATAGMAAVMWMTRGLFLAVPAALGSLTFIFLAWLLRVLTPEEQRKIMRLVVPKLFPKAVVAQPAD
jgi:O-antigen/teichoic acid export membrane protein